MEHKRRQAPPGAEIANPVNLRRFLPYRIHYLAWVIASPSHMQLPDGSFLKLREWRVVLPLGSLGPLANKDIVAVVGVDAGTVTRAVQDLLDRGFVQTRTARDDRRKQLIALTPAGAAAYAHIAKQRIAETKPVEDALTRTEMDTLLALLDKIEAHLRQPAADDAW